MERLKSLNPVDNVFGFLLLFNAQMKTKEEKIELLCKIVKMSHMLDPTETTRST